MRRTVSTLAMAFTLAIAATSTLRQDSHPTIITPGSSTTAPSDAIVLFDGSNLEGWTKRNGDAAGWRIDEGVMLAVPGQGPVIAPAAGRVGATCVAGRVAGAAVGRLGI